MALPADLLQQVPVGGESSIRESDQEIFKRQTYSAVFHSDLEIRFVNRTNVRDVSLCEPTILLKLNIAKVNTNTILL